jgi:hypothetical protein
VFTGDFVFFLGAVPRSDSRSNCGAGAGANGLQLADRPKTATDEHVSDPATERADNERPDDDGISRNRVGIDGVERAPGDVYVKSKVSHPEHPPPAALLIAIGLGAIGELVVLGAGVKLEAIRSERPGDAAKRLADRVRSRRTRASRPGPRARGGSTPPKFATQARSRSSRW